MALFVILGWLLFITLSTFHFLLGRRAEGDRKMSPPPGPKKLPLIGNLHQLGSLPHQSLWQLSRKYGPLMHLQLGTSASLIVSSVEMAREVLKTQDLNFCYRPHLRVSDKISFNNTDICFSPYSEYWKEMRKICMLELFSNQRVHSFRFIREEEVSIMIQYITHSSPNTVNLSKMTVSVVNNIVCRAALGQKYQEGEYDNSQFHGILEETQSLLGSFCVANFFPVMAWIDKLTGLERRLQKNVNEHDAFYEQVIEEHLDPRRMTAAPDREDIVNVLLRLQKDASHLTKNNIKAVLMDIFVAGTETSSATLVWAMAELVKNPRVMKKAQDEVRYVVGSKGKVEEGDLYHLQYLKSVVKETLRLHSPTPLLLPRVAMQHARIEGFDILPGTQVYVNAWGIARDPNEWEDAEEFLPERFMDSSIDFKGQHFQFIPFGSGRRICPAISFGVVMVELVLSNMLYAFDWELPDGMKREDLDMKEAPGVTVHKLCALKLVAKSYSMS